MGFLHKLLCRNMTGQPAKATRRPDTQDEDLLLARLRESRAYRAKLNEEVDARLARIEELGRRYPYTS
jgi:hypothetical protein